MARPGIAILGRSRPKLIENSRERLSIRVALVWMCTSELLVFSLGFFIACLSEGCDMWTSWLSRYCHTFHSTPFLS